MRIFRTGTSKSAKLVQPFRRWLRQERAPGTYRAEAIEFAKTQEFWGPAQGRSREFPEQHPIKSKEEHANYKWPTRMIRSSIAPMQDLVDGTEGHFIIVDLSSSLIEAAMRTLVRRISSCGCTTSRADCWRARCLTEYYSKLAQTQSRWAPT